VCLRAAGSHACLHALPIVRRYNAADITGLTGVPESQRLALVSSGEVDPTATLPGPARLVDNLGACEVPAGRNGDAS